MSLIPKAPRECSTVVAMFVGPPFCILVRFLKHNIPKQALIPNKTVQYRASLVVTSRPLTVRPTSNDNNNTKIQLTAANIKRTSFSSDRSTLEGTGRGAGAYYYGVVDK